MKAALQRAALVAALAVAPMAAMAVQPDEVLADGALEARAREISQRLRCPVCQGENIDESNAPISRDLRLYVRERLVDGDSNAEVIDAVVERYGEFVLFDPRATGSNLILWLAGPLMALIAAIVAMRFLRSRNTSAVPVDDLDADEQKRLDEIMRGP
ncbi:cytochrome c-type biogenesis protein [Paracoccus sp. (in: a-proteobacteria)]|uniref:cytochrome c-type biogenesis protein n=1 Tax=Paracoccus sp. TaxID=267 RepID=UPI00396C3822